MFSNVAGAAPETNNSLLIRCSIAKTDLPSFTATSASLKEALRVGADSTSNALARFKNTSLRLSEASLPKLDSSSTGGTTIGAEVSIKVLRRMLQYVSPAWFPRILVECGESGKRFKYRR